MSALKIIESNIPHVSVESLCPFVHGDRKHVTFHCTITMNVADLTKSDGVKATVLVDKKHPFIENLIKTYSPDTSDEIHQTQKRSVVVEEPKENDEEEAVKLPVSKKMRASEVPVEMNNEEESPSGFSTDTQGFTKASSVDTPTKPTIRPTHLEDLLPTEAVDENILILQASLKDAQADSNRKVIVRFLVNKEDRYYVGRVLQDNHISSSGKITVHFPEDNTTPRVKVDWIVYYFNGNDPHFRIPHKLFTKYPATFKQQFFELYDQAGNYYPTLTHQIALRKDEWQHAKGPKKARLQPGLTELTAEWDRIQTMFNTVEVKGLWPEKLFLRVPGKNVSRFVQVKAVPMGGRGVWDVLPEEEGGPEGGPGRGRKWQRMTREEVEERVVFMTREGSIPRKHYDADHTMQAFYLLNTAWKPASASVTTATATTSTTTATTTSTISASSMMPTATSTTTSTNTNAAAANSKEYMMGKQQRSGDGGGGVESSGPTVGTTGIGSIGTIGNGMGNGTNRHSNSSAIGSAPAAATSPPLPRGPSPAPPLHLPPPPPTTTTTANPYPFMQNLRAPVSSSFQWILK